MISQGYLPQFKAMSHEKNQTSISTLAVPNLISTAPHLPSGYRRGGDPTPVAVLESQHVGGSLRGCVEGSGDHFAADGWMDPGGFRRCCRWAKVDVLPVKSGASGN